MELIVAYPNAGLADARAIAPDSSGAGGLKSSFVTSLGLGVRLETWGAMVGGEGAVGA